MCGISGVYANHITDQHRQLIHSIVLDQLARGPDHQADVFIPGNNCQALLGHNRLSIIDLSEHGNQPMWDFTGRYCIVYNGEIYNYLELRQELEQQGLHFNTASDTEVILNAFAHWGIDCLTRFCGPFAFALFDKLNQKMWLCRDRFGVRPLFYTKINNVLYFASTTRMLSKHLNLKPNLLYVAKGIKYLVYEDGSEMTAYENLFHLPAGHYLMAKFQDQNVLACEVKSYYDLTHHVQNMIENLTLCSTETALNKINFQLEQAVKIRLRTDVPLAISLSGGLDSSSVAALVSRQHNNTIGFSFGHPGDEKSEGPLVAECAKFLNIHIQYVHPTPTEMISAFHETIHAQDAPFSTLSIVAQYLLYKKVRAAGIKVLLGGQGGDEAFMGYKKFLLFWIQQNIKQKKYFTTAKNILALLPMLFSEMTAIKSYWHHRHRYLPAQKTNGSFLKLPAAPGMTLHHADQPLWQRQLQDVTQFSLPTLLRYEDRNAAGNSVESRLPYLDHHLVELGLALPESLKLRAGYGKWPIRKIMQNKIPNTIRLARYKRGFDISLVPLLKAGLGQSIRENLQNNSSLAQEFLQTHQSINELFSDQQFIHRKSTMAEAIALLWLNKDIA